MRIYDDQIDAEVFVKETLSMSINRHLRLKYFCVILLVLNILLLLVLGVVGYVQKVQVQEELKKNVANELDSIRLIMSMSIRDSLNTLFFLSDVVDQDLRGEAGDVAKLNSTALYNFVKNHDSYDQARILNKDGWESIRVNRVEGSFPVIVQKAKLQDKSLRPYYYETINLSTNIAYVSQPDLNMEEGKVELPYKLVMRIATPLFYNGIIDGVLVLNFLGSELLYEAIHIIKQGRITPGDKYFLLNSKGESLAYIEWSGQAISQSLLGFDAAGVFNKTFKISSSSVLEFNDGVYVKNGNIFSKATLRVDTTASNTKDKYALVMNSTMDVVEHDDNDLILLSVMKSNSFWDTLLEFVLRDILVFIWIEMGFVFAACIYSVSLVKQKVLENAIKEAAAYDPLTAIYNRRFGLIFLKYEIRKASRTKGVVTLFEIDVNNLKKVNDTCGHSAGDELLKLVATRLKNEVREYDIVCRVGGDEFIVAFSGLGLAGGNAVVERVRDSLEVDYSGKFNGVGVNFSYGGIEYDPERHKEFEDFMKDADEKMYEDKRRRKQGRQ